MSMKWYPIFRMSLPIQLSFAHHNSIKSEFQTTHLPPRPTEVNALNQLKLFIRQYQWTDIRFLRCLSRSKYALHITIRFIKSGPTQSPPHSTEVIALNELKLFIGHFQWNDIRFLGCLWSGLSGPFLLCAWSNFSEPFHACCSLLGSRFGGSAAVQQWWRPACQLPKAKPPPPPLMQPTPPRPAAAAVRGRGWLGVRASDLWRGGGYACGNQRRRAGSLSQGQGSNISYDITVWYHVISHSDVTYNVTYDMEKWMWYHRDIWWVSL